MKDDPSPKVPAPAPAPDYVVIGYAGRLDKEHEVCREGYNVPPGTPYEEAFNIGKHIAWSQTDEKWFEAARFRVFRVEGWSNSTTIGTSNNKDA